MFVHWHLNLSFYCQCPAFVPVPSPPSECHLLPGTSLTSSIPDRLEQSADQYQPISTIFHANITKCDAPARSCHPLQHSSCWNALRNSPKLILYDKALACGDFFLDKTATPSGNNWYWKSGTRDQDAIPASWISCQSWPLFTNINGVIVLLYIVIYSIFVTSLLVNLLWQPRPLLVAVGSTVL